MDNPGDGASDGPKPRLVVADDQMDLLAMMQDALQMQGFQVRAAANGQEAVDLVRADPPDIVILDLWMPIKDGFEACREIKSDPAFQHIPIILLSAASDRDNKVHGMELGADDFVTKPIDLIELIARIRMILRRTQQGLDANPLTRLPGNVTIQNRISKAVAEKRPFSVLYLDLDSFKAYNDAYGYEEGDKVIKATAGLLLRSSKKLSAGQDFIGHIGGDDFIIITDPERMEELCREVIREFDGLAPSFYKDEDRKRGRLMSKDRQGNQVEFPLLSISIGVCHNRNRPLTSYAQVSSIGTELKTHAKRQPGSSYVIDRRSE